MKSTADILVSWLASDDGYAVHISVFIALLLGGFGFPIPEDIPLLLAGVAAGKDIVSLQAIWLTCYVGVIIADQLLYLAGYFFGGRLLEAGTRSPFFPSITDDKVAEIREGLRKRKLAIIFIGRHLFPVRSVTFLSAGALRVPYFEFLIADAFAALVSVTLVVALGYFLGDLLDATLIEHVIREAHIYLTLIVGILIAYYWCRAWRKNKELGKN